MEGSGTGGGLLVMEKMGETTQWKNWNGGGCGIAEWRDEPDELEEPCGRSAVVEKMQEQ